ncbi:MAG: organic solvent tolerance protein OstA [Acidocella sp. 20-63-7]|nr:MAG: organic solvent tolerance protein OstA [Acidocella sp. 20-63-7]HQT47173.1 LptA/OstA family protein [Acidocella sp.]
MTLRILPTTLALTLLLMGTAYAQSLNLGSTSGPPVPIQITAKGGITWQQTSETVTVTDNAKAVRGPVTVTADYLVAHYRKKPGAPAPTNAADALNQGGAQLYELDAIGHVHIYTATDNAYGDHAVYNLDSSVLVLTGSALKLTTQHDTITARDAIEYYAVKRMAIARGKALIVADDGRSVAADTLIGYLATATPTPAAATDSLAQAGALQKVDAIGHVVIHSGGDIATGDSGVYLPQDGRARLGGDVHIIHGPNEMEGSDALVNMKTGIATLLAAPGGQVAGTLLPNTVNNK